MANPQQALSVLVCVLTAMALGLVARLPTLHHHLQGPDRTIPAGFVVEGGGGRR